MLSLVVVLLAAALLCWPGVVGRTRLASPGRLMGVPSALAAGRRWARQHATGLAVVGAGLLGAVPAGVAGALAGVMVGGTAASRWRASRARRVDAAAGTGLVDALAVLVAELRAGAHPADAAKAAAADGHPGVSRTLGAAAAAARLGGDVPTVLRDTCPVPLRSPVGRLADAWALAGRHGIPLADLLDTVRADAEQRVRFTAQNRARLAGPRATAGILAGLPVLGLALGQAMGAAPLWILTGTPIGRVLLVIGSALVCAGVLWSGRLTVEPS